jgi:hypothetical protein
MRPCGENKNLIMWTPNFRFDHLHFEHNNPYAVKFLFLSSILLSCSLQRIIFSSFSFLPRLITKGDALFSHQPPETPA